MSTFTAINKRETLILFFGDVIVLYISLWLMLLLRHLAVPSSELLTAHIAPFSILFVMWVVVFFIAGLYEKHTTVLKNKLPAIIFNAQAFNSALAVLFFYLIPYFGITPKTNLFIYLIVSFVLILIWRLTLAAQIGVRRRTPALLIGSSSEMRDLLREVNENPRYPFYFSSSIDLDRAESVDFQKEILERVYAEDINLVVLDLRHDSVAPILPRLYNLLFSKVRFIDMHKVYEDIFDRIPISLVEYSWFLENISASTKFTHDALRRAGDIAIASFLGIIALILHLFVVLAIKLDDGGPVLITQTRVGKNNNTITLYKYRTLSGNDTGKEVLASTLQPTKIGPFLRKARIDELPQLWSVLKGDLSLIGPRPEFPALVERYSEEVPYYNVRHLITPGLSGWAQLYHDDHPHHGENISKTKTKLSYDLYYLKNRSLLLDLKIALKTIKTLLSRTGV